MHLNSNQPFNYETRYAERFDIQENDYLRVHCVN